MASGSNRFLQYTKQQAPKEAPAGAVYHRLRTTGGSGIMNNRTNLTSDEIRDDRQIIVSRLGQNQPDVMVPFELSFDSFDELLQGAIGGQWMGGQTIAVNASVDTGGIFTLTTGEWADYPISVGDYVIVNGTANTDIVGVVGVIGEDATANELTVYEVGTTDPITTTTETVDFTFITGHYAEIIDTSANTITVVGTELTITRATGTWEDVGVELGDKLWFDGFSEATNNGWKKVGAVDGAELTIVESELADETLSTGDLTVATSTGFITVGTVLDYFAFEEGFTDVVSGDDIDGEAVTDGVFHYILGAYVNTFSMSVQPDAIVTGELDFQGLIYSGFKNESIAPSVETSNINEVFDSFTGDLYIPNAPAMTGVVTGLDFTLDNGLIRRYALMDKDAISIGDGRSNVTGTLNAYFENADISNLFEQETEFVLAIRTEDLDGNSYLFGWPRVKLTSDGRDVTENDVTQNVGFQALGGLAADKKKTMYVLRQPAIAE